MNSSVSALPLSTIDSANEALTLRLPSSLQLKQQLPLSHSLHQQVNAHRQAVRAILDGEDPRLLVIVGPCSIHDPQSAIEYASKLARLAEDVSSEMLLVMRAYVEKPRTTVGWKGLAYDPHLDGTDDMATGLTLSRELMLEMIQLGLPVATELLQPMAANYFDDLLSWVAIGARTTESQIHREMASGLNMPVGFKNGTDGGAAVAVDAMRSAAHPHRHFGVDSQGHPAIVQTAGNADTHIVLRGGHQGPNYDATSVANISAELSRLKIPSRIMVDCSHANSGKDPLRQPAVFNGVLEQRLRGNHSLIGAMLESHLFDGCQPLSTSLRYGVSITDGCLGFSATEQLLTDAATRLAQAKA
ncbi:3-deoxy-D-arabinoheptulosonate-7-phosphate synthase [Pseudomonas sp. B10]|uniref:3-deoxy-7-phosphoheptulonate synthase n=1 Tax=Pseudomonas sp. B10 TaxID=118613 RepID=UPI0009537AE8|nr:3-deoxy-7-phosphoheptulonate synthase [Pseudomonas sp. B10]SIR12369.1 3-deoxy-D-arabinoheptulosonate-7-phosphate synthase [Pseudomonas sp. B10]